MKPELRRVILPVVVAGAVAVALALAWAGWSYRRMADAALDARFTPRFKEPPAGPRAPRSDAFGARVGASSLADVQALVKTLGVECPDTSARALMAQARANRQREAEERKKKGLPPDAVSGASKGNRPSPMERNPQVRLSCEGLPATRLADRPRTPSVGRLLFVFDSPEHPLRHVSFQRTIADPAEARSELEAAVAVLEKTFGPPTRKPDPRPTTPPTPSQPTAAAPAAPPAPGQPESAPGALPWLVPVQYEWLFTDLTVRVAALNFGGTRGTMFTELLEVPLPIRPDAPARTYAGK